MFMFCDVLHKAKKNLNKLSRVHIHVHVMRSTDWKSSLIGLNKDLNVPFGQVALKFWLILGWSWASFIFWSTFVFNWFGR